MAANAPEQKRPRIELLGKKIMSLIEGLKHESDMLCVIISTSYLELATKTLLHEHFRTGGTADSLLKPNGSLGSLKTKSDLAYCLGLIGNSAKENLGLIGDVRNRFAHNLDITFDDSEVIKRCEAFTFPKTLAAFVSLAEGVRESLKVADMNCKERFISMSTILSMVLFSAAITTPRCEARKDAYWHD